MFKYPQALKIHKKVAQLQLDLKPAKEKLEGEKVRVEEGCVYFSLAKALGDTGKMDWQNKLLMKIDAGDIAKIVTKIRSGQPVDIFHTSGDDRSSSLKIEAGTQPDTYKLSMSKKDSTGNGLGSVYLNKEDMYLIFTLLEASVPLTLGWC